VIERKLRVMMLAPVPYFTECGRHVRIYEEARALMRLGHRVRIVTYHLGSEMPGVPIQRISGVPWCKNLTLGPSWHKPYLDFLLYRAALKEARSFRPHLIHAHLHEGAWIGGRLKKRLRIPLLFDCQGSLTGEMLEYGFVKEGSRRHRYFTGLERRINSGASDYIVTRSGPAARDLIERWGVAESRVGALLDGVDTALFQPHLSDETRGKLRLPPDVPLVVCLGLMNRSQGIDSLLSCIVQLKSKGSPIRFLIMGYPEEVYRNKATELGIDRMITFTGRIDYAKAPFYLSAGDIAVSPKISLNGANGALPAYMACGLPTVSFDTPVNRELLGGAGVYAEYGDVGDLTAKLMWLMEHEDERKRLRRVGRELAEKRLSWDIRGKELDTIYRNKLRR
jgi:glycosyltransferase involved in cell wall biosynthesis